MRQQAAIALCVLVSLAALPQDYGLLRSRADSDERRAPIYALERQAPGLAKAFEPHVHVNQRGERMPYRLSATSRGAPVQVLRRRLHREVRLENPPVPSATGLARHFVRWVRDHVSDVACVSQIGESPCCVLGSQSRIRGCQVIPEVVGVHGSVGS